MAKSDNDPAKQARKVAKRAEALQAELAALQAEAAALSGAATPQAPVAPVAEQPAARQTVEAEKSAVSQQSAVPQQFSLQPTAPVRQKGNGGLIGWLITLSVLALASLAALALVFFGVVNPRALLGLDGEEIAVVSGAPTTTYFAPAMTAGANAFAPDVATMVDDSAVLAADVEASATEASAAPVPSAGDTSGLYGLSAIGCSRTALATKLAEDPAVAAAWAAALSADSTIAWEGGTLAPADIPKYLYTLSGLTLVSDTWATDHGYAGGAAAETPYLLQKGTAVLVDRLGMPRVRCISGNPLSSPMPDTAPVYSGTGWQDFAAEAVVSVVPASSVITDYSVFLPARVTGSAVPFRAYPCEDQFAALLCIEPGPAVTVPDFPNPAPLPAGVVIPTPTECAAFPAESEWVNTTFRAYNGTSSELYVYWTDNTSNCSLIFQNVIQAGGATNGGVDASPIGGRFYIADAAGNVVENLLIEGFTLSDIR